MKLKHYLFLFLAGMAVTVSCSKNEDDDKPVNQTGGEAFRSKIITVPTGSTALTADEYPATFNDVAVTLMRSQDNKLLFLVPATAEYGVHDLVIPGLNNAVVHYDVKETVLPGTPDEVIAGLTANFTTFSNTLDDSQESAGVKASLASFNEYYKKATVAEKTQMATLYNANKAMFDNVLLNDFSNLNGRSIDADDIKLLAQFSYSITVMVGGAFTVLYVPEPALKVLGAAVAVVAFNKTKYFFSQLKERKLHTVTLVAEKILGDNERSSNAATLSFQDNTSKTISLALTERPLTTADANDTSTGTATFFSNYKMYNTYAGKVNVVIKQINSLPFVDISLIPLQQLPETATAVPANATASSFIHLTFSVNHPNVTLVSPKFEDDGKMSLAFKITGTPASLPIETKLSYTYKDDFSSFSGTFPVKVGKQISCDKVKDTDGNSYNVIGIGNYCWTQRNLEVSHYRNGDVIPFVSSYEELQTATSGAYVYADFDSANGPVYGKLYNWKAVNDPRGLAPEGYHVATDDEWADLTSALGGESVAGGKMKTEGAWYESNAGDTNESGFSGMPGGYMLIEGVYGFTGVAGHWWSSTTKDTEKAWCWFVNQNSKAIVRYEEVKTTYFAIRCVKD